jgi:hypothetical protein
MGAERCLKAMLRNNSDIDGKMRLPNPATRWEEDAGRAGVERRTALRLAEMAGQMRPDPVAARHAAAAYESLIPAAQA